MIRTVFMIAGGALAAFIAVAGTVLLLSKHKGAAVGIAIFRGRDFVMWILITWQTIIQVPYHRV